MITAKFHFRSGKRYGLGHSVRCYALRCALEEYGVACLPIASHERPTIAVVDIPDIDPERMATLRESCDVLVALTPPDDARLLPDLVVYQGRTDRPRTLDWRGFCGEWFEGPDWVILRESIRRHSLLRKEHNRRVLITAGGSDPHDIVSRAHAVLADDDWFRLSPIWGPFAEHPKDEPHRRADMIERYAWADVAAISYGMTAFECLASGIPCVAVSISDDHAKSAYLVEAETGGALIHLGHVDRFSEANLKTSVILALNRLPDLSKRAREYVDGYGAERVAAKIMQYVKEKQHG